MGHTRTRTTPGNLPPRFWAKVELGAPDACWEWAGAKTSKGYGQIRFDGKCHMAHRISYVLEVGPIPGGLQIDHLCRNPSCVNPAHLEPVSQRENILRGVGTAAKNAAKTECPQGHPYSAENTFYDGGSRKCRTCNSARMRAAYLRRTEGVVARRNRSTGLYAEAVA